MQKWEYLFVRADLEGRDWQLRYVNDQELPDWTRGQSLFVYANQLGTQGWELVAALMPGPAVYRLAFKRPIE